MDLNLTPDELRALFSSVYERDMELLRKQHDELKAAVDHSHTLIDDQTRQGT
jgi:hypothetical protein